MSAPGDDPDLAAVTLLLSLATERGFSFTPAGEQGSLWGERVSARWRDVVFLGASGHANAARASTAADAVVSGSPAVDQHPSHAAGWFVPASSVRR